MCYLGTVPDDTRQQILEVLRDAAPCAVSCQDLWKRKFSNVHAHIESLRFEGHGITQTRVGQEQLWGWRLDHDAWAGGDPPQVAGDPVIEQFITKGNQEALALD